MFRYNKPRPVARDKHIISRLDRRDLETMGRYIYRVRWTGPLAKALGVSRKARQLLAHRAPPGIPAQRDQNRSPLRANRREPHLRRAVELPPDRRRPAFGRPSKIRDRLRRRGRQSLAGRGPRMVMGETANPCSGPRAAKIFLRRPPAAMIEFLEESVSRRRARY